MPQNRSTMIDPPIEALLDRVDSKFTLVTLASKRARQINSYFNQLGEGLGAIVPPQVPSLARKPLSIALEEIAAGKIVAVHPPEVDEESEVADEVPFEAVQFEARESGADEDEAFPGAAVGLEAVADAPPADPAADGDDGGVTA